MEKADILKALRDNKGNITRAARAAGLSRQTFYNQITPEIDAHLAELRERVGAKRDVTPELIQEVPVDPEEVTLRAMVDQVPERSAARAVLIGALASATNRAKRDVVHLVATTPALASAFEARLPAETDEPRKVLLAVSLTVPQWRWIREQGKGTAARLLAELKTYPKAKTSPVDAPRSTSFLVSEVTRNRLYLEAQKQGVSHVAVFRAVVDRAIRAAGARAA